MNYEYTSLAEAWFIYLLQLLSMKDVFQVYTKMESIAKSVHEEKKKVFLITFLLLPLGFLVKERRQALIVLSSSPLKLYLQLLAHLENE